MAVTFQQGPGIFSGTSPLTSPSFTPIATGDMLLGLVINGTNPNACTFTASVANAPSLLLFSSSNIPSVDSFATQSLSPGAQTFSINDQVNGSDQVFTIEYSASTVSSYALTNNNDPGTGTGAIVGQSVNVPSGSLMVALCVDFNFGTTITSPSGTNRATGTFGISYNYCYTEYTGAGSNIQPTFTSASGAGDIFVVSQWVLAPAAVSNTSIPTTIKVLYMGTY